MRMNLNASLDRVGGNLHVNEKRLKKVGYEGFYNFSHLNCYRYSLKDIDFMNLTDSHVGVPKMKTHTAHCR